MNKTVHIRLFIDMLHLGFDVNHYQFAKDWNGKYIATWMGKRVIMPRYSDEIVLFECCEYCGNISLNKDECCISCGAPAYR